MLLRKTMGVIVILVRKKAVIIGSSFHLAQQIV